MSARILLNIPLATHERDDDDPSRRSRLRTACGSPYNRYDREAGDNPQANRDEGAASAIGNSLRRAAKDNSKDAPVAGGPARAEEKGSAHPERLHCSRGAPASRSRSPRAHHSGSHRRARTLLLDAARALAALVGSAGRLRCVRGRASALGRAPRRRASGDNAV